MRTRRSTRSRTAAAAAEPVVDKENSMAGGPKRVPLSQRLGKRGLGGMRHTNVAKDASTKRVLMAKKDAGSGKAGGVKGKGEGGDELDFLKPTIQITSKKHAARMELVGQVAANKGAPGPWVAMWEYEKIKPKYKTDKAMGKHLYRLLSTATNSVELGTYAKDPQTLVLWHAYLDLVLTRSSVMGGRDVAIGQVRDALEYMKNEGVGTDAAAFYIYWADFEYNVADDLGAARRILERGQSRGAEPAGALAGKLDQLPNLLNDDVRLGLLDDLSDDDTLLRLPAQPQPQPEAQPEAEPKAEVNDRGDDEIVPMVEAIVEPDVDAGAEAAVQAMDVAGTEVKTDEVDMDIASDPTATVTATAPATANANAPSPVLRAPSTPLQKSQDAPAQTSQAAPAPTALAPASPAPAAPALAPAAPALAAPAPAAAPALAELLTLDTAAPPKPATFTFNEADFVIPPFTRKKSSSTHTPAKPRPSPMEITTKTPAKTTTVVLPVVASVTKRRTPKRRQAITPGSVAFSSVRKRRSPDPIDDENTTAPVSTADLRPLKRSKNNMAESNTTSSGGLTEESSSESSELVPTPARPPRSTEPATPTPRVMVTVPGSGSVKKAPVPAPAPSPAPPPSSTSTTSSAAPQPARGTTNALGVPATNCFVINGRSFVKLEVVGKGGSSKVYKVMAPNRKIYACKRIRFRGEPQSTIDSYVNEITLLKRLQGHDNIISLLDSEVKVKENEIFLIMEYGETDLSTLLKRQRAKSPDGKVDDNFIRFYWQQMLQAVHTIHEERIVHGDLKPANFLLVDGQLKLIDFGIAKAISNDTTNIVRDNQIGTINYMSPEAILDTNSGSSPGGGMKMKLGRPSDIWSLGCILYQMVYGQCPFAGLNIVQKLQAIINDNHKISYPSAGVTPALVDTLRSCLLRDPKARLSIPDLLSHAFVKPIAVSRESIGAIVDAVLKAKESGGSLDSRTLALSAYQALSKASGDLPALKASLSSLLT